MLARRNPQEGIHADRHFIDAVKRLVACRTDADGAAADPAIVKLVAVAGSKADVPQLIGEGLQGVGQNGAGVVELAADVGRQRPLVGAALPDRRRQAEVMLHVN